MTIAYEDFARVDVRVGTVLGAAPNTGARKPAYLLEIDFGPELGVRRSSAQLTENYTPEELVGRQVAAVVNFPPRQIAKVVFCPAAIMDGTQLHVVVAGAGCLLLRFQ